ncbi:MAG: ribonuclease HII [Chloroflexi bacterium]|nr:ribonuclease HII [Chloroflexota bacterium]
MKKQNRQKAVFPSLREEEALFSNGYRRIAGLDEAGRGALAGPVVAAAVILPPNADFPWLDHVKDSKLLCENTREEIFMMMVKSEVEIGIGIVTHEIIDAINILNATKKAMKNALEQFLTPPDYLLIDAIILPRVRIPQKGLIKGDRFCLSIACASIIAKVTRDHIMLELDTQFPQYGFGNHKGYGTREHLHCLQCYGVSGVHRLTYAPVRAISRLI